MSWFEFAASDAKVFIRHTEDDKALIVISGKKFLGEGSVFAKNMIACNQANREGKGGEWINFKYSEKANAWHRPLADLKLADLMNHFPDDLSVINIDANKNAIYRGETNVESRPTVISSTPTEQRGVAADSDTSTAGAGNEKRQPIERIKREPQSEFLFDGNGRKVHGDRGRINEPTGLQPIAANADANVNMGLANSSDLAKNNLQKRRNFSPLVRGEDSDKRSKLERYNDNIQAIELIRASNPSEYELSENDIAAINLFSGWGGLSNEVISTASDKALSKVLSSHERRGLTSSALYGYFTPNALISSMWDLLQSKGYIGGLVLEPSCGTGRFITQRLPEMDDKQHFTGVEIDTVSAQVASALHPQANIINTGFEKCFTSQIKGVGFDLVVGNFPFGEMKLIDETGVSRSIHNHFIVKSLEALRSGGIMCVITSTHTLDSKNTDVRTHLSKGAQLLGAIRLPNNLFEGTSVQCDLLFLRKRGTAADAEYDDIPFINTTEQNYPANRSFKLLNRDGDAEEVRANQPISLTHNECFSISEYSDLCKMAGTPLAGLVGKGTNVGLILNGDMSSALEAIRSFSDSGKWFDSKNSLIEKGIPNYKKNETTKIVYSKPTVGGFVEVNGAIKIVESFQQFSQYEYGVTACDFKMPAGSKRDKGSNGLALNAPKMLLDYINIRDCVVELLQSDQLGRDEQSITLRESLNELYSDFIATHGYINSRTIRKYIRSDALVGLALGLEKYNQDDESKTTKAVIFSKSTVKRSEVPTSASTLVDAVSISISQKGGIDQDYIESLTSRTLTELTIDEPGIIYFNPETHKYEHRTKYLTGNVVQKLHVVEGLLDRMPELQVNANALMDAAPPRLKAKDIGVSMGARWLPNEILIQYVQDVFKTAGVKVTVELSDADEHSSKKIKINYSSDGYAKYLDIFEDRFGTKKASMERLINSLITSTPISITTLDGIDRQATATANHKREILKEDFDRWILDNAHISEAIEDIYNNKINVYNYTADFSDINYTFPNMASHWIPQSHQADFVLSGLLCGNRLNSDCVGAGKTMMQVMLAHELSRLGHANFPVIVVPNHMLYQTAGEAQQIYPSAKICIITKEDLQKENRSAFVAKMTMNNWDFAVITYSMNSQILPPVEYLQSAMENQVDKYRDALLSQNNSSDRISSRDILKRVKKLEEKLESLNEVSISNQLPIQLDQVGIDAILYDEFHKLKNLELDMVRQIPGISNSASQIAFTEYQKMRYIMDAHYNGEERGIYAFTATPISNSIAELYSLTKMLKPSILLEQGIYNFNDWAAQYGNIVSSLEVLPEGGGFQLKSRLSSFQNLPELLASFRSFTQSHTREQLNLPVPAYEEINVVVEPKKWSSYVFKWIIDRASNLRFDKSSNDNFLAIVGDAAMAAISPRAFRNDLPDEYSKVNKCADNVASIYHETTDVLGTQLIFCDRSVPAKKRSLKEVMREILEGNASSDIDLTPAMVSELAKKVLASEEKKYSAYEEIKAVLISKGVPENEIAFIHDAKTDEARDVLLKKVDAGIVRVLIGSTEKLGTGTNVQKHLVALHDLDIPWTPKELEQRKGRGVRRGNENAFIKILRYLTKGSFDVFRLETIKRKALAIESAMSDPRSSARRFDEDTTIDYDTMIAETTDNPIVREKAKADALYTKLQKQEQDFYESIRYKASVLKKATQGKERIEPMLEKRLDAIRRINDLVQSAPRYIHENGDKELSANDAREVELRQRMMQAQFTTPKMFGYCDGETVWLDYRHASKVFQEAARMNYDINIYGESAYASYNEFKVLRIHFFKNTRDEEYFCHEAQLEIQNIFGRFFQVPVIELADSVKNLRENLKKFNDQISTYSTENFDLKFPKADELLAAQTKKMEIEFQISELSKVKKDNSKSAPILSIDEMLRLYRASGCSDLFDPNDSMTWGDVITDFEDVDNAVNNLSAVIGE